MKKFFATRNDYAALLLRVGAGATILPFGLMKLGIIGGGTFGDTMHYFATMGIPSIIGFLVIMGESVGAVSLIIGFCTRFCAASLVVIMAGAVVAMYGKGFFMGYLSPLVFLLMVLPLIVSGAGAWSLDGKIAKLMR